MADAVLNHICDVRESEMESDLEERSEGNERVESTEGDKTVAISEQKLKAYFSTVWTNHATSISVIGGIIAIVTAVYGLSKFVDSVIDERVIKRMEVHTEMLSALFVQQANSPYNAARRYRDVYVKTKSEYYPQDLREALVTGLLESINDSGFPEEFENIVEQINSDENVSLQRHHLNNIAAIYIQLGYTEERSVKVLEKAIKRVEKGNAVPKQTMAESHWLLCLSYLTNGKIEEALAEFRQANRLKPDNYRLEDLTFEDENSVRIYVTDFSIFERMELKNKDLVQDLLKFSKKMNGEPEPNEIKSESVAL